MVFIRGAQITHFCWPSTSRGEWGKLTHPLFLGKHTQFLSLENIEREAHGESDEHIIAPKKL